MSGFGSKSVTMRMLVAPRGVPADLVEKLGANALPAIQEQGACPRVQGWTGWRHLLDRPVTADNVVRGGWWMAHFVTAEGKVPAELFKAEVRIEEIAALKASGKARLSARERSDIRASVAKRLADKAQPFLKGSALALCKDRNYAFTTAVSESALEDLLINARAHTGLEAHPLTPSTVAVLRGECETLRQAPAARYGAEDSDLPHHLEAGADFLTWLLFMAEGGGIVQMGLTPKAGAKQGVAISIEGPLVLGLSGTRQVTIKGDIERRKGAIASALQSGMKLVKAKVLLADMGKADVTYACTLDAELVIRSLKVAGGEQSLDAECLFAERMDGLCAFQDLLLGVFGAWLRLRVDAKSWAEEEAQMEAWVQAKK